MNGVLNAVFPALNALDDAMATVMPAWLRLVVFGILSGAVSMGLYSLLSNQEGIKAQKAKLQDIQRQLKAAGDDLALTMSLSRQNLSIAFGLLGRSAVPAILSSLPIVFIIAWLAVHWGYQAPPEGTPVPVTLAPADVPVAVEPAGLLSGQGADLALQWPAPTTTLQILSGGTSLWTGTAEALASTGEVGRPRWYSSILGNPAGYLPADGPLDTFSVALPEQELLGFGPWWVRTWWFVYFLTVVIVSLAVKFIFKID
ncbi:MAG: hypothetical protein U1E45_21855 [Geminicoccaceae bacterium]